MVFQITPILRFVPDLLNASLDLTQDGQARTQANPRESGLKDSSANAGGPIHCHANVISVEYVDGHHYSPISRRILTFASRFCSSMASAMRS